MAILGLFPTQAENQARRRAEGIAGGRLQSSSVQGIQRDADKGRKAAFANAYNSRGNTALAQRQANQSNNDITVNASGAVAQQTAQDQEMARSEMQRMEAERVAGINNAIGMGAQGAGLLFGGPAGGAAAKAGANTLTGGITQGMSGSSAPTAAPAAPSNTAGMLSSLTGGSGGAPDVMSLIQGANAPQQTAPSPQGQANVAWATTPQPAPEQGMAGLYDRPGLQRDPAIDDPWRRQGMLSDERMKNAAANGSAPAAQFLDQLTQAMEGLRQTLPADLQASADKAIQMVQPEGFTGETVEANENKDWNRPTEVFDNVEPQSFEYSPEGQAAGGAPGQQLGVMAQDVEQFAPQMVNEDPAGNKRIDVNQGLSAVMAAQAELNQRIRRLEGDPLADLDSESADPLDNLRDTERPDIYSRPGNQRDVTADRPAPEGRYEQHHRFLSALGDEFRQGNAGRPAARNARRRSGVRL